MLQGCDDDDDGDDDDNDDVVDGDVDGDVDDDVDDDRKLTHHMTGLADESPGWCQSSILLVRIL